MFKNKLAIISLFALLAIKLSASDQMTFSIDIDKLKSKIDELVKNSSLSNSSSYSSSSSSDSVDSEVEFKQADLELRLHSSVKEHKFSFMEGDDDIYNLVKLVSEDGAKAIYSCDLLQMSEAEVGENKVKTIMGENLFGKYQLRLEKNGQNELGCEIILDIDTYALSEECGIRVDRKCIQKFATKIVEGSWEEFSEGIPMRLNPTKEGEKT